MKKVFCLMKYYLNPKEKPPFPKFDYQMTALKALGYDVYYLGVEKGVIFLCNNDNKQPICKDFFYKIPFVSIITTYYSIYKAAAEVFKKISDFDYAYIRAMPAMPSYVKVFKKIKLTDCRVVVEIPTYPIEKETDKEKRVFRRLFSKYVRRYSLRISEYVDLYVLIGEKATEHRDKPAINIENGINVSNISLRTPNQTDGKIHFLGLATMAHWHGYDRVIEGIREYREKGGQEMVLFHLVGSDGDGSLEKWRGLTKKYNLEDNVIFEGPQYGENLVSYFNECHLAIGSIAIHRTDFTSAATLKAREYMARGIPFVLSARDQGINPNLYFYLKIAADDSPVDIDELIRFAKETGKDEGIGKRMREYAQENMTWERQFLKVFRWFRDKEINENT